MPPAVVFPGQGSQPPAPAGTGSTTPPGRGRTGRGRDRRSPSPPCCSMPTPTSPAPRTPSCRCCSSRSSPGRRPATRSAPPVAFAGHSLGQITALIAAGAVAFDDGVRLAVARAEATQRGRRRPARRHARPARRRRRPGPGRLPTPTTRRWLANVNAPGQIVVGGTPEGLAAVAAAARASASGATRPLAVGGAFHTPLMAPAAEELGPCLDDDRRSPEPTAPVVTNHDGAATPDRDRLAGAPPDPPRRAGALGGVRAHALVDLGARRSSSSSVPAPR